MKTVPEILNLIASEGSTNFKQEVLEKNKKNLVLKDTIRLTYDSSIQYGIKKIPEYIPCNGGGQNLQWALDSLDGLSSRLYTGQRGIDYLKDLLENLSVANALVLEKVIKRDLDCGFGKTISRRVWPDLFPEHYTMLCMPQGDSARNKKNMKNIRYPAMLQLKVDGMRMSVIVDDGSVTWKTRQGKVVDMMGVHDKDFLKIAKNAGKVADEMGNLKFPESFSDCVIDGELLMMKEDGSDTEDRKTGNGLLNKIIKGKGTKELCKRVRMVAWDIIPLEDFYGGFSEIQTDVRYNILRDSLTKDSIVSMTVSELVDDAEQADVIFQKYLVQGLEGAVLKNRHAPWKEGRSKDFVKMKGWYDIDLKIIGINPHKKRVGQVGSLDCSNRDGSIIVNVGTGLTDADRKTINKNDIGKIVEVRYNAIISKCGSDVKSLFLPVFVELREDKKEADL